MNAWGALFERFDQKMYKSQSPVAGAEAKQSTRKQKSVSNRWAQ